MNGREILKRMAFPVLTTMQVDRLFRYFNRKKVLILAYHGVTKRKFEIKPWTLISVDRFEEQIRFISENYNAITLKEAIDGMTNGRTLADNPAVITFDDGYRNNLTVALPILQKYVVPATIFLTAGYIGSENVLPLDEVFLVVTYCRKKNPVKIEEINLGPLRFDTGKALQESYLRTVAALKRCRVADQKRYIKTLKDVLDSNYEGKDIMKEFLLLSREEVATLLESELIDIGAHTVRHEILANLPRKDAEREISESKALIEEWVNRRIELFAYPNGAEPDYNDEDVECLKRNEFICSVSTVSKLNGINDNPYRLGRMSIGPEYSSNINQFALRTSGFISAAKSFRNQKHV